MCLHIIHWLSDLLLNSLHGFRAEFFECIYYQINEICILLRQQPLLLLANCKKKVQTQKLLTTRELWSTQRHIFSQIYGNRFWNTQMGGFPRVKKPISTRRCCYFEFEQGNVKTLQKYINTIFQSRISPLHCKPTFLFI